MTMRFLISWVGPFRKAEDDNLGVRIEPRKRLAVIRQSPSVRRVRSKTIGWPPWQSVQSTRTGWGRQVKAAVS